MKASLPAFSQQSIPLRYLNSCSLPEGLNAHREGGPGSPWQLLTVRVQLTSSASRWPRRPLTFLPWLNAHCPRGDSRRPWPGSPSGAGVRAGSGWLSTEGQGGLHAGAGTDRAKALCRVVVPMPPMEAAGQPDVTAGLGGA